VQQRHLLHVLWRCCSCLDHRHCHVGSNDSTLHTAYIMLAKQ
jgi:hypothetical protein